MLSTLHSSLPNRYADTAFQTKQSKTASLSGIASTSSQISDPDRFTSRTNVLPISPETAPVYPSLVKSQPSETTSPNLSDPLKLISGRNICYPVEPVLKYIQTQWDNLLVTHRQLLEALQDPKVKRAPGTPWRLYISERENPQRVWQDLQKSLPPEALKQIQIVTLPPAGSPLRNTLPPGLLYLPNPYVVPGGRFKEMYGWDSYFIQLGLLKNGRLDIAKGMTDNLLYEIEKYGTILNANRTYYVNRSQPPFISRMVLDIFNKTGDKAWLGKALPSLENHYAYWTSGGHLIREGPAAGLSRYFSYGEGPALEVVEGEIEGGKNHYERIQDFYRTHPISDYDVRDYYDFKTGQLTPLFFKADQTMRESGFDPSDRFGPFNIDVLNYAPVCLNSLLYSMERDMSKIYRTLDNPNQADAMEKAAENRKERMNRTLWDDKTGMFLDYNFKTNQRRFYPFATMFFPLWAGLASPEQAARTVGNLPYLEAPGGLMTSANHSGNQWDAPFSWAPLQLVAVQGMLNYPEPAAKDAAVRLSTKFVNQVAKEFKDEGGIFEKYDASSMESDTGRNVGFGYKSNEIGFGWTNAVFLELLDVLKRESMQPKTSPVISSYSFMPNSELQSQFRLSSPNILGFKGFSPVPSSLSRKEIDKAKFS